MVGEGVIGEDKGRHRGDQLLEFVEEAFSDSPHCHPTSFLMRSKRAHAW